MKEFDFDSVWEDSDDRAEEFYRSVEPKILEMAQRKSSSILEKIKSNVIKEWTISAVILVGVTIGL